MISIVICELNPISQVSEIYYEMLMKEKDAKLRKILDNKEHVLKMNSAVQKVWERKKSEEEEALEKQ